METTGLTIRFHGELNDFLPRRQANDAIVLSYRGRRTIKDLAEALGVPHVEIDRIQIGSLAVGLDYIIQDQDDIEVYPGVRCLYPPRFIVDANVAKLCPLLRMLGFDTLYAQGATDAFIASISEQDKRSVLTRDLGLLKRKIVASGLFLRSTRPIKQAREVMDRFNLRSHCQPFSRCLVCNHLLHSLPAARVQMLDEVPLGVRERSTEFFHCSGCQKVFWRGSHHENMEKMIDQVLSFASV